MICQICEIGELEQETEISELGIDYKYHLCNYCGSEVATPTDLRYNKARFLAYKRENNGRLAER